MPGQKTCQVTAGSSIFQVVITPGGWVDQREIAFDSRENLARGNKCPKGIPVRIGAVIHLCGLGFTAQALAQIQYAQLRRV